MLVQVKGTRPYTTLCRLYSHQVEGWNTGLSGEPVLLASQLVQPVLLLFIVMDPLGNAPFFYTLTREFDARARRRIINESVAVAAVILVVFAVIGDLVMSYLGVDISDFKIAAGLVLLVYSVLGFLEIRLAPQPEPERLAIVPLATPLLAGPGAIASVIYIKYSYGLVIAIASTLLASAIALPLLHSGQVLDRVLGKNGQLVLDKIMMLLMAAFAVAIIRDGVEEIVKSIMAGKA